jgi:hypothetical protein
MERIAPPPQKKYRQNLEIMGITEQEKRPQDVAPRIAAPEVLLRDAWPGVWM